MRFLVTVAIVSCGSADEPPDMGSEPAGLPAGYVVELCRCQKRPPPEPAVQPWSKCASGHRELYFCEDDLMWCPSQLWGWKCTDPEDQ